jgi:hypothetical protein
VWLHSGRNRRRRLSRLTWRCIGWRIRCATLQVGNPVVHPVEFALQQLDFVGGAAQLRNANG